MKHAYRIAALLLLSGAASLTAQAQTNYQPGYVLSLSGDTVRGAVDFRQWTHNPTRIDFRSAAGETKSYAVADIRGFQVASERYESAVVQVDGSPYKLADLPKSSALQMRRDEAFVRVLFSGPKSLYYYQDRNDKEHFFIRQNGALELLLFKQFIPDRESNRVVTDKSYIDQLQPYLADCPSIGPRLRATVYNMPGLQKLFTAYYACTGTNSAKPEFQQSAEAEGMRVEVGLLAGMGSTQVKTETPRQTGTQIGTEAPNYARSVKPAGGLFVEIRLPRRLRRLSFVPELFYTAYQAQYSYALVVDENHSTRGEVNLDYRYAKANLLLRYRHPIGSAGSVFVNGGISGGYAFKDVHTRRETLQFYSQQTTTTKPAFGNEEKTEQSFILGVGGRIMRLSAEGRIEAGNGMLRGIYQKSSTQRMYVLLGYRF